jgi:hypothetical protein
VLPVVIEKQGFGASLAFVVTGPVTNRVDSSPIRFRLRMLVWVAIDLAGRCLQYPDFQAFGQSEQINRTVNTGLRRLNRVILVMNGRCGAGEIVYFVNFNEQWKRNVMPEQFETIVVKKVRNIGFSPGIEVIDTQNLISAIEQQATQMGS